MSSAAWTTRETMERQMKRALELRAQGMTSPAMAALIGITAKTQKERFFRHDRRTNGADRPPSRQQVIPAEKREQAVVLLKEGKSRRGAASKLKISLGGVQRIKGKALVVTKPKTPRLPTKPPEPEKPAAEPIWTKARRLAAERLLKKRHCLEFVAEEVSVHFPGPPVLPRDVAAFQRELRG